MLTRLLMVLAVTGVGATACAPRDLCENRVLKIEPNPSHTRFAIVFSRECGATVGANVQVSVLPSEDLPDSKGNTLIVDSMSEGAEPPMPEWRSDTALDLTLSGSARVFVKETSVNGVAVTYLEQGPDSTAAPTGLGDNT